MRMTKPLVEVAVAMMRDQDSKYWGYRLMKETGLRSVSCIPCLIGCLPRAGWSTAGRSSMLHVAGTFAAGTTS